MGWIWVVLMVIVAASSFWINELRLWGPWSPIHLLAIFTLAMLPLAVLHARRHRVGRHRNAMIAIFAGALVVARLLTLMPGRIMHGGGVRALSAQRNRAPEGGLARGSERLSGLDHK